MRAQQHTKASFEEQKTSHLRKPTFLRQTLCLGTGITRRFDASIVPVDERLSKSLGKVRPDRVKKVARELLERYPNDFSTDFESNKKTLAKTVSIYSPRLRNRIAGYITRLAAISKAAETEETEEESAEDAEEGIEDT